MKVGSFNIHDYLDKLYEAAETDEKEKKEEHEAAESEEKEEKEEKETEKDEKKDDSSKKSAGAPAQKAEKPAPTASKSSAPKAGGETKDPGQSMGSTQFMDGGEQLSTEDGIVNPPQNVKFFKWLKGEYQKGKVEVKVEMKLGDKKFEPGYDLQTNLDSVKDFKPGMFGEVKTAGSNPNLKTNTGNQPTSNVAAPNTNKQVTGLSKPAEEPSNELQRKKTPTVSSQPSKPSKPEANVGNVNANKTVAKPAAKPEEKDAEIEKIDIKTKKEKNAK